MTDKTDKTDIIESTLTDIIKSKDSTTTQRLLALDRLRKIEHQRSKDALAQEWARLKAEEIKLKRRENDTINAAIELDKIREKTRLLVEQRKRRAADKAESRALDKALEEAEQS